MGGKQTRARKHLYLCLAALILLSLVGCEAVRNTKPAPKPGEDANQHLLRGQELFARKDFEGALNESLQALPLTSHRPPEDEILFLIGMIYAHPEYSKRDQKKSIHYFSRVVQAYPQSPWAQQARVWMGILQENEWLSYRLEYQLKQYPQKKGKDKEEENRGTQPPLLNSQELLAQGKYDEAVRELQKMLSTSPKHPLEDQALFYMGLIYAHPGNPKKDDGKSMAFFRRLIKDYPKSNWAELAKLWVGMHQENDRLHETIEKLNETIEKSKRVDIEIEEKKREKGK